MSVCVCYMLWLLYCIYTCFVVLVPECSFVLCKAFVATCVLCAQEPALCEASFTLYSIAA